ncbi:MAG: hypothetical protein K8U03_13465 [Planctomycetia bacterium]|nr:hypothetical protein [Planctomycetia bacterium]
MKMLLVRLTAIAVLFAGMLGSVAPATAAEAPDVYFQKLLHDVGAGNGAALWKALPEDYQGDVEDLVEEFAKKMDAEIWDGGFKTIAKLAKVLKEKKEFVFGSELLKGAPAKQKEEVQKNWDAIVEALQTTATSDISTLAGVKELDLEEFFEEAGNKVVGGVLKASENSNPDAAAGIEKFRKAKVTLVSTEGDDAVLKLETEGEKPKDQKFTRVDGKWLPAELVEGWDDGIEKAKAQLAALKIAPEQKAQVMQIMTVVDGLLDRLLAAKDQAAFDKEIQGMMAFLPMFGAGPPGGAAPAAPAAPKSSP